MFGSRFGSHAICFLHSEVNLSCLRASRRLHTLFLYTSPSDSLISGGNFALHTISLLTSWDRFFMFSSKSGYTLYFDSERIFPPCNLVLFLKFLPLSPMLTPKFTSDYQKRGAATQHCQWGMKVRLPQPIFFFVRADREQRDIVSVLPCSPQKDNADLEKYNSSRRSTRYP